MARLRHWRQRFNPNAAFVWRRSRRFGGGNTVPGEVVPPMKAHKLRNFWEAGVIELRDGVGSVPVVEDGGEDLESLLSDDTDTGSADAPVDHDDGKEIEGSADSSSDDDDGEEVEGSAAPTAAEIIDAAQKEKEAESGDAGEAA